MRGRAHKLQADLSRFFPVAARLLPLPALISERKLAARSVTSGKRSRLNEHAADLGDRLWQGPSDRERPTETDRELERSQAWNTQTIPKTQCVCCTARPARVVCHGRRMWPVCTAMPITVYCPDPQRAARGGGRSGGLSERALGRRALTAGAFRRAAKEVDRGSW